jgi:hypothetical protein
MGATVIITARNQERLQETFNVLDRSFDQEHQLVIADMSTEETVHQLADSMPALEEFIACKHDPSLVHYIHEDMKPILESTYGCMIYQEQLLDIVRTFGGRSYGGADLFRKAVGKKNKELIRQESEKLYQEIIDNGYSEEIAKTISDDLATKGGLT